MDQFRLIHGQPGHVQSAEASWKCTSSNMQTSRPKPRQQRHKHSQEEWDELRDFITQLYIEEDKKAEEVLEILSTRHNFRVGLRKLKEWLKSNGTSKNVQKSDMFILNAKRRARMTAEGKKTIVYKDGRVLDDARLDRFGERNYLDADSSIYLAAATPDGYTYATPETAAFDEDPDTLVGAPLFESFTARRPVQAIFGEVLENQSSPEQEAHIHQIGVLGLRTISEPRMENLPSLLRQSLLLAKDLIGFVTSSSLASTAAQISTRHAPTKRVPKVHITYTRGSHNIFTAPMENNILSHLKRSETCLKLLQLDSVDQTRWKQDWYAMTSEEQSVTKRSCDTFFGIPSDYSSIMAFIHISVLLASPNEPADTVIARISLGVDTREFPGCNTCQRRVMSMDCISATGAMQLNVPLQSTWGTSWEPLLATNEITEHVRWSDYVYSLRGWFIHLSSYLHRLESLMDDLDNEEATQEDEQVVWSETWDPMDVFTPLATFQPYDVAVPAAVCAYSDFELIYTDGEGTNRAMFEPNATDNDVWNPNAS